MHLFNGMRNFFSRTRCRLSGIFWRTHHHLSKLRTPQGMPPEFSSDNSLSVPFRYVQNGVTGGQHNLAVICHIYHADLSEEILKFIKNIRRAVDIFIATDTSSKVDYIKKVFQGFDTGKVVVRIAENRGRDIATKLVTFRDVYHTYDIVLHLHSKKDNHGVDGPSDLIQDGSVWRRFLLKNLVGSPEVVSSVLDAFSHNPKLGMIIAQHWEPVRPWIRWLGNFKEARRLLRRMDISLTRRHRVDFPSGSMFWAPSNMTGAGGSSKRTSAASPPITPMPVTTVG
ncbi:MAG: rhamnan synthesis F family protein, partial [Bryobacteraceae bacterium]